MQGVPQIRLYDDQTWLRSVLYVEENRPALNMYDAQERLRLSLYLETDGAVAVTLFDETETRATGLAEAEE